MAGRSELEGGAMREGPVGIEELRVLDGPNLYFSRPAIKLTLAVPGWMAASEPAVARLARRLWPGTHPRVGAEGTEQRRRAIGRIAAHLTRRIAVASGVRRLAVRTRPGPGPDLVVVAFPWRRRAAAEALAREVARTLADVRRRSPVPVIAEAGDRLRIVEPGAEPTVPDPDVPVIQVTGTNGKTTTVRLLAHLVRMAGRTVAYSSTDGVYRDDGVLVEAGDYSGFGGAARALAQHPDVAVLETARGGMLLRGAGVLRNDVAVVTNVSEDHLGLHGIDTIDQLAEVKSIITRITRADGWDVLNADDPRVLAMRRHATGRPWICSLRPDHPAIRETLIEGGRAMTVLDGRFTWLERHDSHALVPVIDVPLTLSGISRVNVHNAMAAAAAGLAIGLPHRSVVRGLRTFELDPERNPGRANLFRLEERVVVVDYAHNEAGMIGLTEVLSGLRPIGRAIWLSICTAGDRTDPILHAFAFRAAAGSDHLAIAELVHYLRGRTREDIVDQLLAGASLAGVEDVDVYEDELRALRGMLERSAPGDVVSVTALGMRPQIFAWLDEAGATRLGPRDVRRLVRQAQRSRIPRPGSGGTPGRG
jgi:cyanophycin synthetase